MLVTVSAVCLCLSVQCEEEGQSWRGTSGDKEPAFSVLGAAFAVWPQTRTCPGIL